jgi:hypothetical protein
MSTVDIVGGILVTFAMGAGFGYYMARIFFGV